MTLRGLHASLCAVLAALSLNLLGLAAPAFAGQPVTLRPSPADENGRVTLGDLFDGAGEAASVVVASGRAGTGMVLDAGRVQMLARVHGLDWDNATGIQRLVIQPGSAPPPTLTVTSRSTHAIEVLAYAHDITTGEIIQPDDLAWSRTAAPMPDAPRDARAVIGMAARHPLREGFAVAEHDVAPPQVIKKDDVIALVYTSDGVTLTLQGKAMENAVAGQSFTAINQDSKKVIQAVAVGPGQALVGPQADRMRAAARFNPAVIASIP